MKKERKRLTAEQKKTIKHVLIGAGAGLGLGGLAIIPVVCAINTKHNSGMWSDFTKSGGPVVYDNDVVKMVKEHSRLFDRLNPGRMVDMTFMCFDILNGSVEKPKNENWRFSWDNNGEMIGMD